jgi:hypothetical protein
MVHTPVPTPDKKRSSPEFEAKNALSQEVGGGFRWHDAGELSGALERQAGCLSRQDKQLERRFREHADAELLKNAPLARGRGRFSLARRRRTERRSAPSRTAQPRGHRG